MKEECREVLQLTYLYLDGEGLTEEARLTLETHLDDCPPCWERVGLDKELIALVHQIKHSSHCPEALKARIFSLLEDL